MFWNNVIIALRNLRKHKVFAIMNVLGLAIGLVIFVFGNLLVRYESNHDANFANADRVYTIGSIAAPGVDFGVSRLNSTYMAMGPIIEAEVADTEHVAAVTASSARTLLKLVCYHDLVGDVLGRGRDEQQILDVVDDVEELDMLFAIGRADVTALTPRWWDEECADRLYGRCVEAIESASED